jgi:hypothetical protein
MNLIAKRKLPVAATTQGELDTIETTIKQTIETDRDVRNLGFFDYRLRIPCGVDKYDS